MGEDLKILKQAENNVLRGIDIESAAIILEKKILDYYIIDVNILRLATRQILNFIEKSKIKNVGDKNILDYVRENVKLKEENKQQADIIKNSVSKDKIKEIVSQIQRCEQTATELIEERIVIADSNSLNFGRKQAHNYDIELIKHSLLEGDK